MNALFFTLRTMSLGGFGLVAMVVVLHAEDPIPRPFKPGRYEKLAAHSPFSPPTAAPVAAPPPVVAAGPKPFEKYTMIGLGQQGNDFKVTLLNKETTERFRVSTKEEGPDGLMVASVEWAKDPSQMKVTLRKGTDFGVVGYDPGSVSAGSSGGGGAAGRNPPAMTRFPPPAPVPLPIRPPPGTFPGAPPGGGPSAIQAGGGNNNIRRPAVIRSPGATQPVPMPPGLPMTSSSIPNRGVPPAIPGTAPVPNDDDDDDP